jgi:hypothetical protein
MNKAIRLSAFYANGRFDFFSEPIIAWVIDYEQPDDGDFHSISPICVTGRMCHGYEDFVSSCIGIVGTDKVFDGELLFDSIDDWKKQLAKSKADEEAEAAREKAAEARRQKRSRKRKGKATKHK